MLKPRSSIFKSGIQINELGKEMKMWGISSCKFQILVEIRLKYLFMKGNMEKKVLTSWDSWEVILWDLRGGSNAIHCLYCSIFHTSKREWNEKKNWINSLLLSESLFLLAFTFSLNASLNVSTFIWIPIECKREQNVGKKILVCLYNPK